MRERLSKWFKSIAFKIEFYLRRRRIVRVEFRDDRPKHLTLFLYDGQHDPGHMQIWRVPLDLADKLAKLPSSTYRITLQYRSPSPYRPESHQDDLPEWAVRRIIRGAKKLQLEIDERLNGKKVVMLG
jgi:hypothetical protein